ncbi:MAG: DUF922 domain-containing protein [Myxococcota bacterium]|nr:DUF922 domain-containing protein [Myxococcota bacterium]
MKSFVLLAVAVSLSVLGCEDTGMFRERLPIDGLNSIHQALRYERDERLTLTFAQSVSTGGAATASCNRWTNESSSDANTEVERWSVTLAPAVVEQLALGLTTLVIFPGELRTTTIERYGNGAAGEATVEARAHLEINGVRISSPWRSACQSFDRSTRTVSHVTSQCNGPLAPIDGATLRHALHDALTTCGPVELSVVATIDATATCQTGRSPGQVSASGELIGPPRATFLVRSEETECAVAPTDPLCGRPNDEPDALEDADFAGRAPGVVGDRVEAYTVSAIVPVDLVPGESTCLDGRLNYRRGEAFFYPNLSWTQCAENDTAECDALREHERLHYMLTKTYSCALRAALNDMPCPRDSCRTRIAAEIGRKQEKYLQDLRQAQEDYDAQTHHSVDVTQQAQWAQNIRDDYEFFCGEIMGE